MKACEIPSVGMFSKAVHLNLDKENLGFEDARRAAFETAKTYYSDPMLLSWYERKSKSYSPNLVECCADGKPSWVSYAESRGGDLTIDVNHEDYVFMFRGPEGLM